MKTYHLILSLSIVMSGSTVSFTQDGEQLFRGNCASCHTVGKGKLVGPDLMDVQNRHDMPWMLKWVKSSQSLVKAGDKQAVKLYNDNNKIPMPDVMLSEDQVKSLLGFVTTKSTELASAKTDQSASNSNISGSSSSLPVSSDSKHQSGNSQNLFSFTEYVLMAILCLLLIVIRVLSKTIRMLTEDIKSPIEKIQ